MGFPQKRALKNLTTVDNKNNEKQLQAASEKNEPTQAGRRRQFPKGEDGLREWAF